MKMKDEPSTPKGNQGQKTIEQLLTAGLDFFAKYGPDGVTTRQISKGAGVNSAAIAYYFGGKEGYYLAVIKRHIERRGEPVLALLAEISKKFRESEQTPDVAASLLEELMFNLSVTTLLDPTSGAMLGIYTREHLQPTSAFDMIHEEIDMRLHGTVSELVGCITQNPTDSPETVVQTYAVLGQILHFRISITTACRFMHWDEITEERAEVIAKIISKMASRSLGIEAVQANRAGKEHPR